VSVCRALLAFSVLIGQHAYCADNDLHANRELQSAISKIMAGHPGAAIVLNVASGQIEARSHPEVAAGRLAAPGSAIKPFTLLALLHSGHFDPEQRVLCRRSVRLAGHAMNCTHPDSPTPLNAAEALAYSCNFYFAAAASHVSAGDLREEFEKAGLSSETHLGAPEATGQISVPAYLDELQLQALGAWGIEITPLEMASAYRGLALRRKDNTDPALAIVFAGLEGSTAYGMAHAAQPDDAVAGKTGTASSTTFSLTHGWFAGYAPAQDPKIVVVVFLEHGRGIDAASLARKIFDVSHRSERKN
jgi:cell division protein FtsI/penicillin-binding protein 2